MKRFRLILIIALAVMVFTLAGCEEPTPALTTPTAEPTQTEPTEFSVEEDVFYFSHGLEYNRLYSQRLDGSDLTLVLDETCYNVFQHGQWVYYTNTGDLYRYHIPTASSSLFLRNVIYYQIDGDHLVYTTALDSKYTSELRSHNLSTGENTPIAVLEMAEFSLRGGYVYYYTYDTESWTTNLWVCNLKTGDHSILSTEFYSYSDLLAVDDGIYFYAWSDELDGCFFSTPDGSPEPVSVLPENGFSQLLGRTQQGLLYIHWDYSSDSPCSIRCIQPNGTETVIVQTDSDSSLSCSYLKDGYWLTTQSRYCPWGALNEYGYTENSAFQLEYSLLQADGTLTALDTAGEMGSMFAGGDFPIVDSSTARKPVTAALYNLFVKNYDYQGAEPVCSTTHGAWLNIADRTVDLALLAAPTQAEQDYLASRGVEVEMKLYGGDGLVFIGNAANPVTELTQQEILAIYRGEITNWSQVGGPDHPISVYFRDDQSGSQRLFESMVFAGQEIPDFYSMDFYMMDAMSTLVGIVLNDPYAIGYSIMTYLDEVYAEEELQVFAVDGVIPSPQTVKDQSYPYHTRGFVVIRADEPADSPARRLFDWFGCPASDALLTSCSVSPLHED